MSPELNKPFGAAAVLGESERQGWAVFPGSFDPFTRGHLDVVQRALEIFPGVVVAVLNNLQKSTLFSVEERLAMIGEEFSSHTGRVEVRCFSGLLVDFVRALGCRVILRGLRAVSDYEYEAQMALMNRNLCVDVETLFLMTREENSFISSSMVKQVASLGGNVARFVPPLVERALLKKLSKNQ